MSETMTQKPKSRASRTKKRSKSGADQVCPVCGKRLRGAKGLAMHMFNEYGIAPAKDVKR